LLAGPAHHIKAFGVSALDVAKMLVRVTANSSATSQGGVASVMGTLLIGQCRAEAGAQACLRSPRH
jgi:hypothetical protein